MSPDPTRPPATPGPQAVPALTLHQPWASLIAVGVKSIETRSWPAPAGLVGERIAIHAAARKVTRAEWSVGEWTCVTGEPVAEGLDEAYMGPASRLLHTPLGAIVATARLADCLPMIDASDPEPEGPFVYVDPDFIQVHDGPDDTVPRYSEEERWYGHYESGRWAWLLADVQPLEEPVPAKGRQRVWRWER